MAADIATAIGREVMLARTNIGLTLRAAARLAGVSPTTFRSVERGAPSIRLTTLCRVASALGVKVWAKGFPVAKPSLRDTGQLVLADVLRVQANAAYRFVVELALGNGRSIDVVLFGATEIIMVEIYRQLADLQAQYRAAIAKRDELAAQHQRPVRLVLVVEDTRRNRTMARQHATLLHEMLPAGSRDVLRSVRSGSVLGRDGILWLRRPSRP